jgi:hypothetical protein
LEVSHVPGCHGIGPACDGDGGDLQVGDADVASAPTAGDGYPAANRGGLPVEGQNPLLKAQIQQSFHAPQQGGLTAPLGHQRDTEPDFGFGDGCGIKRRAIMPRESQAHGWCAGRARNF